ncbi:Chromo domain-containing protein, partial [Cephalotus follicularis]
IKTSNDNYKEAVNEHRRFKEFAKGDMVMVYLTKERYPKGTYQKLKSRKIVPCKIIKKISSNAYVVELPDDLQISPIFNVEDLSDFHGFTNDNQGKEAREWADQLPKKPKEVIEEVLGMTEARSRRGRSYLRFLVKWLGKPSIESTWISEEELKRVDLAVYEYVHTFSSEPSLSSPREMCSKKKLLFTHH